MRTATEAYNAQRNMAEITGARDLAWPTNPIVRTPDPQDYDGLARAVCRRAMELDAEAKAVGLSLLEKLVRAEDNVHDWLDEVGHPKPEGPESWEDETDWREAAW